MSGSFPDYEQIIPKEYVSKVTLLKADLLKGFECITIVHLDNNCFYSILPLFFEKK